MAKNFTQEQYENAINVNIVDYLNMNNHRVTKKGREFSTEKYDSLSINAEKNTFYWYSKNKGGGIIQLVEEMERKTFVDAVLSLNGEISYNTYIPPKDKIIKPKELKIPLKNADNKKVISYLANNRNIDYEVINHLIKKGTLYESGDRHEVVFVGFDKENKEKYAYKRSTLKDNNFKGEATGSQKEFAFKYLGKNIDKVFVFEAPIDLVSHMTLSKINNNDFRNDTRLSLGGVSDKALARHLKDYNVKEIVFFLDNDIAGLTATKELYKKYKEDYKISIFKSSEKDLNETLIKYKEDKIKDESVTLKSYIKNIKESIRSDKLLSYTKNILKDENMIDINNLIEKGQLIERNDKSIITNGDIGYQIDIFNNDFENTEIIFNKTDCKAMLFKDDENKIKDNVIINDNIITTLFLKEIMSSAYVPNIKDMKELEKIILDNNFTSIIINSKKDVNIDDYKQLEEKLNVEILIETNAIEIKEIIKDEYLQFKKPDKAKSQNKLYEYLYKNTNLDKVALDNLFINGKVYQSVNNKAIFTIKEDNNIVGGYELDISKNELKLMANSPKGNILKDYIQNIVMIDKDIDFERGDVECEM